MATIFVSNGRLKPKGLMDDEFKQRLENARSYVDVARRLGDMTALAHGLKELGNIERRPPFLRHLALNSFSEAAQIYHELALPLEEAWVLRHIGIIHEYAERLVESEKCYDDALTLYRSHAKENTLDYANSVRYSAVIKNRLGKRNESRLLWEEAAKRYEDLSVVVGMAEAAAWLAIFAIEKNDLKLASTWFKRAKESCEGSNDEATFEFIDEVKKRLETAQA